MTKKISAALSLRRVGGLAAAAALTLTLAACGGGGGGGGGSSSGGEGSDKGTPPDGAVALVDGRVGDSPFYDDGSSDGYADGRHPAGERASAPDVSVQWSAVQRRVDGAPLSHLAGYRIYYGNKAGNYEYVIEVADPDAESYTISNLPSGTFYFATTAVDAWNQESPLSGADVVTVN